MPRNDFCLQHKLRTSCAPEVLSTSTPAFVFSKLSAWEIQLWLNSGIRSQHAKPAGWENRNWTQLLVERWNGILFLWKTIRKATVAWHYKTKQNKTYKHLTVVHSKQKKVLATPHMTWFTNFKSKSKINRWQISLNLEEELPFRSCVYNAHRLLWKLLSIFFILKEEMSVVKLIRFFSSFLKIGT